MTKFALVTGATSGIGRSIAVHLSKQGITVLSTGRRLEKLDETQKLGDPAHIIKINEDVSTEAGRSAVVEVVSKVCNGNLSYIVHNAGTLGVVTSAANAPLDKWKETMAVNVEAPFFLTQALLPHLPKGARILNIGSGAASSVMEGWSLYCISKAAALMASRSMAAEYKSRGVLVTSLRPGVVDTEMQAELREANADDMPTTEFFKGLHENRLTDTNPDKPHQAPTKGLDTPENVAHFVSFLLLKLSDEEYAGDGVTEFDIRDPAMTSRWV
jgi:benzil reductase ((S)-benzoin forming)